jgi:DNA-binding SARP family transcriptional activator
MMWLTTFGRLSFSVGGLGEVSLPERDLLLLSYVVCAGKPCRRERVIATLWPEVPYENGSHSLSQCVYRINTRAKAKLIRTADNTILVDRNLLDSDIQAVQRSGNLYISSKFLNGPFLPTGLRPLPLATQHWIDRERANTHRRLTAAFLPECERLLKSAEWDR